jgi:hypothetical protein
MNLKIEKAKSVARQLRGVQERYKDEFIGVGEVRRSEMARDSADIIDKLIKIIEDKKEIPLDGIGPGCDNSIKIPPAHRQACMLPDNDLPFKESFEKVKELVIIMNGLSEPGFDNRYMNDPCFNKSIAALVRLVSLK